MPSKELAVLKKVGMATVITTAALMHIPLVICLAVLLAAVVPSFSQMFADLGTSLPGPTQFVLTAGHHVRNHWIAWLAVTPLLFAVDAASVIVLARYVGQVWAWAWTLIVAVLLTILGVGGFVVLYWPLFRAVNQLS